MCCGDSGVVRAVNLINLDAAYAAEGARQEAFDAAPELTKAARSAVPTLSDPRFNDLKQFCRYAAELVRDQRPLSHYERSSVEAARDYLQICLKNDDQQKGYDE